MKKQIFLTNRSVPLPGWLAAFPQAEIRHYPVAGGILAAPGDALIWLHVDHRTDQCDVWVGAIRKSAPGCPLVVLSNVPNETEGLAVLEAGAAGYTSAIAIPDVLRQIETVVGNGGLWVGPDLLKRLLVALGGRGLQPRAGSRLEQLTPREREVALAVAAGATNKEIARQLDITERTVKAHLSHIFETFHVRDRLQLSIFVNGLPTAAPTSSR